MKAHWAECDASPKASPAGRGHVLLMTWENLDASGATDGYRQHLDFFWLTTDDQPDRIWPVSPCMSLVLHCIEICAPVPGRVASEHLERPEGMAWMAWMASRLAPVVLHRSMTINSVYTIQTNLSLVRVSYALRIAPPERWNHPMLRKTPVLWSSSHVS